MRFILNVELGNEAMQSYADMDLATRLLWRRFAQIEEVPTEGENGKIVDINGNVVGKWEVIDQPAKPQSNQPTLDSRELATVLHGLRMIQCEGRIEGCMAGDCEHFTDAMQLTNWEIDELCDRLNV